MTITDESVRGTFKRKDSAPYLFMYEKPKQEEDYATLSPQPTLERKTAKAETPSGEKRRKSKGIASFFPFFRGDKKKKRKREQEAEEAAIKAQVREN